MQNYAGIWVQNKNGRGWYEYRDMTSQEFGNKWLELRDAGYRLQELHEATGTQFVGVTDTLGVYRIPVRIGDFRITAELSRVQRGAGGSHPGIG